MKLRFRLLLLILKNLFKPKQPMAHVSRLRLRVWPVDVDIKKVNIERFFAFGDLGWASMLMDWGIFRQILTSCYAPVMEHAGTGWLLWYASANYACPSGMFLYS